MPDIQCSFTGCTYQTGEYEASIAIAMLNSHVPVHQQAVAVAKVEKATRPRISAGTSTEEWAYFMSRWSEYKGATQIKDLQCTSQLLECCTESLRNDLFRVHGSQVKKSEDEVITAIKQLAVRVENTMVARVTLSNMRQDNDEPVRQYAAKLKGQAGTCKFTVTEKCNNCNHDITHNYSDTMVRDALIKGLADIDIQQDLLGKSNQDMTLEEVTGYIEAKETAKKSASLLSNGHTVGVLRSNYQRNNAKTTPHTNQIAKVEPTLCSYCRKIDHGNNNDLETRKKNCPAYGQRCKKCNLKNHFTHLCKNSRPRQTQNVSAAMNDSNDISQMENDYAEQLCTLSTIQGRSNLGIAIDHHLYDNLRGTWLKQRSQSQPTFNLYAEISEKDFAAFGLLHTTHKRVTNRHSIVALADTGCQSCLAGVNLLHTLGHTTSDIIPVTTKICSASGENIKLLGATLLHLSGSDAQGRTYSTKQMVYITNRSGPFYLSRGACADLGIISDKFPTIGEHTQMVGGTLATMSLNCLPENEPSITPIDPIAPCGCPRRTAPPLTPPLPPFPIKDSNRVQLQNYLLEHYKSSTFNTCPHQPLPRMSGPPHETYD